jgi:hypothetical protein
MAAKRLLRIQEACAILSFILSDIERHSGQAPAEGNLADSSETEGLNSDAN